MRYILIRRYIVLAILAVLYCEAAYATVLTFTSRSDFLFAQAGFPIHDKLDFENLSSGTLLPSGSTIDGITFTYGIDGLDMKVTDLFDTISGNNYLGLDDPDNFDQFLDGDEFELTFDRPISALGISFITGDTLIPGDITLHTALGTVSNSDWPVRELADGGLVYFLGLVSTDYRERFSSASVGFLDDGEINFAYNVDEIYTAVVPEPATLLLVSTGGLCIVFRRRFWLSRLKRALKP